MYIWIKRSSEFSFCEMKNKNKMLFQFLTYVTLLYLDQTNGQSLPNLTEKCEIDYKRFLTASEEGEEWAMLMLDANGKVESGISVGNLVFEGDVATCQKVIKDVADVTSIKGLYCSALWYERNPAFDGKGFGFCIPHRCTDEDARNLCHIYNPHATPVRGNQSAVYCSRDKSISGDGGAIVAVSIIALFGIMVIVATTFDVLAGKKKKKNRTFSPGNGQGAWEQQGRSDVGRIGNTPSEEVEMTSRDIDESERPDHGETEEAVDDHVLELKTVEKPGTLSQLLLCFSLNNNIPRLLSAKHPPGSYTCFNGIRFLAMAWIILGHTYILGLFSADAPYIANRYNMVLKGVFHDIIYQVALSVESFFILSSILVTVSFMRTVERQAHKVKVRQMVYYYVHRYCRLTPVYAVVLMFYITLFDYLPTGPVHPPSASIRAKCQGVWWKKLLYIDNLGHPNVGCADWAWYLTCDFQFYVIAPVFLYPAYWLWKRKKSPRLGVLIILLGYVGSLLANIILNLLLTYGKLSETWYTAVYIRPWTKATTYFLGMALGYYLYVTKAKVKFSKCKCVLGWVIAAISLWASVFLNSFITWPRAASFGPQPGVALFISVKTSLFSVAVLWIVYMCLVGQGGVVNSMLSWRIWVPLARLTYVAYLIHPLLQYFFLYSSPVQIYFYNWFMIYLFLGHLVLSMAGAFVITLMFEIPLLRMDKVIFGKEK